MTQRDAFFGEVIKAAYANPNIIILSADSGAPAFDLFRQQRPDQWIHCGIAEANMICVAAGLALAGKRVFCFAILPFITGRCFDQIKVAIALQGLPVTLVGVGAGYSYDDGGPTHYGVEDLCLMRALKNIAIHSPFDDESAALTAKECLAMPSFRYVRLDRHVWPRQTLSLVGPSAVSVLTFGAMIEVGRQVCERMPEVKMIAYEKLWPMIHVPIVSDRVVTLEEHFLAGGFGASVSEYMHDQGDTRPLLRCAIPDRYEWENGGRAHLWKRAGLDVETLVKRITAWMT